MHQCSQKDRNKAPAASWSQPPDSTSRPKKKLRNRHSTSGDVGRKGHAFLLPRLAAPPPKAVSPSCKVHSPSRPACQLDSLLSFQAGNLFHILANCVQVERIWWKKPQMCMWYVCVCRGGGGGAVHPPALAATLGTLH